MAKISDLPEEVLILVFSFFNLRERKVVSQVSLLWSRLAFTRCPMQNIALRVADYLSAEEIKVLFKSSRCYLSLILEWTETSHVLFMVDVLDKFGSELRSLRLLTYGLTAPTLGRLLLNVPVLRKLIIERDLSYEDGDAVLPSFLNIRALQLANRKYENEVCVLIPRMFPNLTSLDLVCTEDNTLDLIEFFGSRLKRLNVFLEYSQFQKFVNIHCLRNVESINIHWPQSSNGELAVQCLQQMLLLKSASLTGRLSKATFDLICNRWRHLEHLCINVHKIKAATFRQISSLKKLKTLKLQGFIQEQNFLKDVNLPTVRHLILEDISAEDNFYSHLAAFVPNLRRLRINDADFQNAHLRLLTKTLTSLRVLSLEYCYEVKDDGFQFLNNLIDLIELNLWSVPISENAFLRFPTCPKLRTFSIGGIGWITNKSMLDIPEPFPNLLNLSVVKCFKVDEDSLRTLRKRMKQCAIVKLEKLEVDQEAEAVWAKCW